MKLFLHLLGKKKKEEFVSIRVVGFAATKNNKNASLLLDPARSTAGKKKKTKGLANPQILPEVCPFFMFDALLCNSLGGDGQGIQGGHINVTLKIADHDRYQTTVFPVYLIHFFRSYYFLKLDSLIKLYNKY